jgi:hypothetical protein
MAHSTMDANARLHRAVSKITFQRKRFGRFIPAVLFLVSAVTPAMGQSWSF